jgi:5'-nucleotidase
VKRPTFLVSNDDGVNAPGIVALSRELASVGTVMVVAPDRERSASGHSLTIDVPIRANRIAENVVAVEGTPTDCVLLAVKHLLTVPPDLVVSGVNRGPNMGDDVTYSGTVAAAMEGTILGIPSIAVSLDRSDSGRFDFSFAARVARRLACMVLKEGLPGRTLLNVNVPNLPPEQIAGIETARLGKQVYEDSIIKKVDPRGRGYYWIGGQKSTWCTEPGTDFEVVSRGCVAVTAIHLDLTDYDALTVLSAWELRGVVSSTDGEEPVGDAARDAGEEEA